MANKKNMSATVESNSNPVGVRACAGKFLTFSLSAEYYGIAVLKVREIIKLVTITSVPQMPEHVRGVVNLRGKIIPVVDLSAKFGMKSATGTDRTCIIVVQVISAARTATLLGLVVDSVEEVLNITTADIEETPDFGTTVDTSYLVGMAKIKGKVVSLLDIDRVVSSDSQQLLTRITEENLQDSPAAPK
jgi:purine-binding chemotaxis protein CheW